MNTDPDVFFVIGVVIGLLAFPALLNSFTHGRAPLKTMLLAVVAAGMLTFAVSQKPVGTYTASSMPSVFAKVFAGS